MRHLILAGDRDQAAIWARDNDVNPHSPEFVDLLYRGTRGAEGMRVMPDDELVLVGTWWRHAQLEPVVKSVWRSVAKSSRLNDQVHDTLRPLVLDWAKRDERARVAEAHPEWTPQQVHERVEHRFAQVDNEIAERRRVREARRLLAEEVREKQAALNAVADAETQRLHELHLRRGGTR